MPLYTQLCSDIHIFPFAVTKPTANSQRKNDMVPKGKQKPVLLRYSTDGRTVGWDTNKKLTKDLSNENTEGLASYDRYFL